MILRRYMMREVATHTALVLGFLVVLMLGGRLIRYFGIAAEGGLDVSLLFTIIGYNLPYFLELILPLAFFIALMLVFGRLYVDNEMAVINGSGISRGRLARLMIPLILVLFVAEAGLSVFGKPWGVRESENIWQQQALSSAFDLIRPNEFINSGNYHLYVGSLSEDRKELQDVVLIQTPDVEDDAKSRNSDQDVTASSSPRPVSKDTIILAKRAMQVNTDPTSGITQLDLYQGRRYEIGADSLKYNQVGFERYRISLSESPKDTVTKDNIETQKIIPLWRAATAKTNSPATPAIQAARAEIGYRFTLPWLMIIAPMLAVPLAQVRPRQGRWLRLFPAILLYVSCALAVISLKNAVSKGNVSVWANAWVVIGFMAFALYLNWASRLHHRVKFRKGVQALPPSAAGGDSHVK
ncbi:LPS export ABC transporter permease LptF [Psychrobacter pygoscelis]|uniref:LPS export ABC transporter permease LptF n=1 Tax=Psychrobacter pygoscelis TaxID=2488563 RepID=UPI00241834C7|nr:LPS export ABC transporter permease LptF [Psychrobacter pygoscelis]